MGLIEMRLQRQSQSRFMGITNSVSVAGDDAEGVAARWNVGVVGHPARAGIHPICIETRKLIPELHLFWLIETEACKMNFQVALSGQHAESILRNDGAPVGHQAFDDRGRRR